MHDCKGRELRVGDTVLIPCEIELLSESEEYCNISVKTLGGRIPDGSKNSLGYLNTRQVIRANKGDETSFSVVEDNGKFFIY